MITVSEVASRLNVSNRTVQNWIDKGLLTAYQFSKEYRIKEEDFEAFLEKSKTNKTETE